MGKLTNRSIAALKPRETLYRVADGDGLTLEVTPSGSKRWRIRYRYGGREQMLSAGLYPEVGLAEARERLAEVRRHLREGRNPSQERRQARAAQRAALDREFSTVSEAWLMHHTPAWAPATARKARYVVERYLRPALAGQDIADLGTPAARHAIALVAAQAPALAVKARGYLGSIVEFAIGAGLREDGRTLNLRGAIRKRVKGHLPAATTPEQIRRVINAIAGYKSPVTQAALRLAMLTAQRPGVVASARWGEFDLERREWLIPASKMKTRHAHIVPLSRQAIETVRAMLPFTAGREYVFPPLARQLTPHLHRDALSAALRRMGLRGEHTTHGFRAMLRTVARERLGVAADVLEAQLAHAKRGEVAAAYDRTKFLKERHEVMQRWADYLDELSCGD